MRAFRENPSAFHEKHKQSWNSNSKKKGYDKRCSPCRGHPEATYHYHIKNFGKEDSDTELKQLITDLFTKFHERYGYKRITKELNRLGHAINHKKVYRIMRELGLKCVKFMRKSRKYNSCVLQYKSTE